MYINDIPGAWTYLLSNLKIRGVSFRTYFRGVPSRENSREIWHRCVQQTQSGLKAEL